MLARRRHFWQPRPMWRLIILYGLLLALAAAGLE
jgi:hypothetical protein